MAEAARLPGISRFALHKRITWQREVLLVKEARIGSTGSASRELMKELFVREHNNPTANFVG